MNKSFLSFVLVPALISALLPAQYVQAAGTGDLIKCPDFAAVYYLAEDAKRYVFPNENIFFSWQPDFSEVREISCEDLAAFPLGDRIIYQAGTRLVKLPSDPSVFAVEEDGVLREIPSEEAARELFGNDWSTRVDDVSEAFWGSFTVGEPLSEGEIPEGTILVDDDGMLFRMSDDQIAVEIETVLDTDDEKVLEQHAISVADIEERIAHVLALVETDTDSAIALLESLLRSLRPVNIEDEDEVEVDEIEEIEDDEDEKDDAEDAIADAEDEIEEAQEKIAKKTEQGKDVEGSGELLASAEELLSLAKAALTTSDFATAEAHADEARHEAMRARGKAVDKIEEKDGDNEVEKEEDSEDVDEDELEDDSESESDDNDEDMSADEDEDEDAQEGEDSETDDQHEESDSSSDSSDDDSGSGEDSSEGDSSGSEASGGDGGNDD